MKKILEEKAIGFYFVVIAAVLSAIAMIRFLLWAPNNKGMDTIIVAAFLLGIILDIYLMIKDNDYITIAAVACYSVAVVKLFTNSVGSFVDAFQGINMFGDSSQVGNILSIGSMILISVLVSIVASFLKRVKE